MRTCRGASDRGISGSSRFALATLMGTKRPSGPTPAMALDFLGGALPGNVTFSRASNATMFDSAGRLVWAPAQGCSRGNMLSGAWGSSIVTDGTFLAGGTDNVTGQPSGITTWTTASPGSGLVAAGFSVVPGTDNTFSIYLRYINHQWARVTLYSNTATANQVRIWVDLLNKVAGTINAAAPATLKAASVTAEAGGWVRVTVSGNCQWAFATDAGLLVASATSDGSAARVGNGAAIEMCAPLLEPTGVDSPKAWQQDFFTAGATYYGPRLDYNPATLAARGLLIEEARTNLDINNNALSPAAGSPATVVRNAVGITGLANDAWTITDSATLNYQMAGSGGFTATAAQHTISYFVKAGTANRCQLALSTAASSEFANFSLVGAGSVLLQNASTTATIQQYGNGWYRVAMTVTLAVAGLQIFIVHINSDTAGRLVAYSGTGLTLIACHTQAEVGAFATSLIPTFGAAATRAGDVADLSSAPAYNPAGVTYYASWERYAIPPTGVGTAFFSVGDGSSFLSIESGSSNPAQQRSNLTNATVQQGLLVATDGVRNTAYKFAVRWAPNDGIAAQNGTLTAPDNIVSMPASLPSSRLWIGRAAIGSALQMHGWMREIRVYATGLSNAELQALTS